jgi:hypothetical protein
MGIPDDQDGIIIDFIKLNKAKSVSLLGSGWLLDIPIRFLEEEISDVFFYDIRHPATIRHKYRQTGNFRFIKADLTGGLIEKVYLMCNRKDKLTSDEIEAEFSLPVLELQEESDCYISVNLLNQLDIHLVDYLKSSYNLDEALIRRIREKIQRLHVDFLQKRNSCIITDYEELGLNDKNEVTFSKPLIFTPLPQLAERREWIWNFDTNKTYIAGQKTYFKVMAIY